MGAVLLTGATGFVGMELLHRFLSRGERHVYALARAPDDTAAAARLPDHPRLTAVAGDIEQPGLGLAPETARRLTSEVTTVMHCAASVSFDLPLPESRRVNVDGTRNVLELAERCERLDRLSYVSTAYVAGEPAGVFGEDQLDVGQRFRNSYERSKFEAELMLRERGGAPAAAGAAAEHRGGRQPYRAHLLVQRPRTGRSRASPAAPFPPYPHPAVISGGRRAGGLRRRPRPMSWPAAGLTAPSTWWRVATPRPSAASSTWLRSHLHQRAPGGGPARSPTAFRAPAAAPPLAGPEKDGGLLPVFSMRVRFNDRKLGPAPPVEGYFGRLIEFAQAARWGRREPEV